LTHSSEARKTPAFAREKRGSLCGYASHAPFAGKHLLCVSSGGPLYPQRPAWRARKKLISVCSTATVN
jgi:hypothetical protein